MRTVLVEQFCSWSAWRTRMSCKRVHDVGIRLVFLERDREHHVEEVRAVVELGFRVDQRLSDRRLVSGRRDRPRLAQQPGGRALERLGALHLDDVGVVAACGVHHRREDRHRVALGGEAVVVLVEPLVQHLVAGHHAAPARELIGRRQLAVDDEPRRLEEGAVLGHLLDRDATVPQDPALAVDEGDRRLARAGIAVPVVERDDTRLGTQLRDVDRNLVLGPDHDRQVVRLALHLECRRLGHRLLPLRCDDPGPLG